ncbi:MAG: ABC transporter ATP-binding protein [Candidatus Acidiferrales bacterium]
MPPPSILVESLEKYFPPAYSGWRSLLQPFSPATEKALAGISFSVEAGEAVALVGPNGAGKSTLLRILATLIIPTKGRAMVGGFDTQREATRARRQFGYHTGGDEGFYGRLSGRENLAFFAAMNNIIGTHAHEKIQRAADCMRLTAGLDRQVRTYSTGMVHRLGLARALLHDPAALLLDEPTRSLDPLAAADFRFMLKNEIVRGRGTTLLFASHTLSEVDEIADRVIVLDQGLVAASGTPAALRACTSEGTLEAAMEHFLRDSVQEGERS